MRKPILLLLAVVLGAVWQVAGQGPATAAGAERHGLRGDYYLSSAAGKFDFAQLKATVIDPDLELPDLNPVFTSLAGREDDVTVRWTGRIQPAYSEAYTFSITGDNGFRLWVDDTLVIDHWVDDWDKEQTGVPITLEAGRKYDVKVEYFEHYGGANLHLRWQSASQPKQAVPAEAFYLPEGFDPPGPDSAALDAAGDTATLDFGDTALAALPAGAAEHFGLTVAGTKWTIQSAALDGTSKIKLKLAFPIPRLAADIRASYDGKGGLTEADGSAIEAFTWVPVTNTSTYVLKTRWSDKVDGNHPLPEYPRPQLVRDRWQNLNGTWQFAAAEEGEAPPFGRDLAERIVVPYPVESSLSGIGRHEDRMWYRRTFEVPAPWKKDRVLLHLDAVDYESVVYVNGKQVGAHKGGYDRFTVDVTDALTGKGRQELVVGVSDATGAGGQPKGKQTLTPGGIWYTPASGIWQTVWMEPVGRTHIEAVDTIPEVLGQSLRVKVRASGDATAVVTARAGERVIGKVSGPAGKELAVPIPDPHLWTPDDPYLYDLTVELKGGDRVESYFGMRSISVGRVNGTTRVLLNGAPVFQFGPLDQGYWPDGIYTAPTDEALRYDLEQTKALGFNMVRKHMKVESDRWYAYADKLGLLVWQDMPSTNGSPSAADKQQFESELREMVDQHRSSPSIVMWVPFNESWGQYDVSRIADYVESLDPSRLVDNMSGINCCGSQDGGNGDVMDYHIYPGPGSPGQPGFFRASVLGEYGGLALPVVGHTWTGGGWGYAVEADSEALTKRFLEMDDALRRLHACNGLSAAVYTQTTDVETEINGLMTYDRAVTKPDVKRVHDANTALTAEILPACA
ncbi:PA14 domain-containing protein [Microbispora rosea]|uniref:PA14 domain-containing protein n=1 Tax=Microbispora rosea TaxID=58117 RepID=UPI003D91418F